jgi:hypothetical protein
MSNDFIPASDKLFHLWQENLLPYIDSHRAGWTIPDAAWNPLPPLQATWRTAWAKAEQADTRTHVAIVAKDDARHAYQNAIRQFLKAWITYNPAVTDTDRAAMELPIHDLTPTPTPVPTTYPDLTVEPDGVRSIRVIIRDHDSPSPARPHGATGAVIRWAILPMPPAVVEELTSSVLASRSPHVFTFQENQRGQTLYLAASWQNAKGEKGPWSVIANTIIP